mgnify:CR=1 FL=1
MAERGEPTIGQRVGAEIDRLATKDDLKALATKADLDVVKADVADLKPDVAELKTDVAELKTDVAELKTDVAGLKTDVAGLKTDVAELKTDMRGVKGDMDQLKGLTVGLIDAVNANTRSIEGTLNAAGIPVPLAQAKR